MHTYTKGKDPEENGAKMGYYASTLDIDLVIPAENVDEALERINHNNLFHVNQPYNNLPDAFGFGFNFELDEQPNGDMLLFAFEGDKYFYDTGDVFWLVRDLIRPGSYVQWMGEDHEAWQWRFDGREMYEDIGVLAFHPSHSTYAPVSPRVTV